MSTVAPDVVAPTAVATHAPRAIAHEVVWGPISKEEADACRALAPCSAVLLSPLQTAAYAAVEQAVRAVIPQEILPHDSDTADSLRKRLAQSAFLDDGLVRKGGAGEFTVPGLMKLVVKSKPATKARKGVNPFTCEEMMFKAKPARRIIKVRALKKLKEMAG